MDILATIGAVIAVAGIFTAVLLFIMLALLAPVFGTGRIGEIVARRPITVPATMTVLTIAAWLADMRFPDLPVVGLLADLATLLLGDI